MKLGRPNLTDDWVRPLLVFRYAPYVCLLFPDLLLFVPRPVLAVSPGNDSGSEGALNSSASKNFLESPINILARGPRGIHSESK